MKIESSRAPSASYNFIVLATPAALIAGADVDQLDGVVQSRLLQEHRDLAAVRRRPEVELDFGLLGARPDRRSGIC
jgi:hypothetical protein